MAAKLHPDAARLVHTMRLAGRPPFEEMSPAEARIAYAASRAALQRPPADVANVRDLSMPGPAGTIPLRLYRGLGTADAAALPCLLYLHGGGWVVGDLGSHDGVCRRLANIAGCCVAAVDYRLAPEHPFPAAVDDAAAAYSAVVANAAAWGIDPERIAVGGDSAGGNLAAVLALMGREGALPKPVFQLLIYPAVDLACAAGSYARVTSGVPLTAATMRWFIDWYVPEARDRVDWRASPLRAASLAGTPPAFVMTVAHDPLCDEGRAYAERLEQDGVAVTALHVADQAHGLLTMGAVIGPAELYLQIIGQTLATALRREAETL